MRIGIIGTGWGARVQVPAFRSAGLNVVGIAGRQPDKTRQHAAALNLQAYEDWQALIADVDFVSIVTPPVWHREMSLAALKAGKHVLCEKPTALNAAEAQAMADAAQAHPKQLALIDHELRFLPALRLARDIIAEGRLGAIYHILSSVISASHGSPERPWNWWSDQGQGGGVWGAIGSHQLDTIRYLCGEISAIGADLATHITSRPSDEGQRPVSSDDYATSRLRLASGAHAVSTLSVVAAAGEPDSLTITGSKGALRFADGRLEVITERGQPWHELTPPRTVELPEGINSLFPEATVYLAHALRAWNDGDSEALAPAATFADGLRIQQLLDAGRRSATNGGTMIDMG